MGTLSNECWSTYIWNFNNVVYISHAYGIADAIESVIEENSRRLSLDKRGRLDLEMNLKTKNPIVINKDTTGSITIQKIL